MNQVYLGFTECFVSNYPCRFCHSSKEECHAQISQTNENLRNVDNYNDDVNTKNVALTGIVESCIWNDVNSFHVVYNYSVDLMHDLLEGVCNYDMSSIIRNFILEFKYFSLEVLNNRIRFFDYGPSEIKNRPPLISEHSLKSNSPTICKMSASEMWCFVRFFGLMMGDLVPIESDFWKLYILLKKILDLTTTRSIGLECPYLLKMLISEHHALYLELTKINLKPKFHHLIHYPYIMEQVGPLINIWSMRFEAKHKESKIAARAISSRKNICYTLMLKNQLKMAYTYTQIYKYSKFSCSLNVSKNIMYSSDIKKKFSFCFKLCMYRTL